MKAPWSAPWAFANWPFELAAGDLDGLPKLLPDPDKGRYVARPTYRDADDVLFVTNMRAGCRDACHYERSGPVSHLSLVGYGSEWFRGHYLPMPGDFRQPWTGTDPGSAGPEVVAQRRLGDDAVLATMDLHHAYLLPARLPTDKPDLAERLARQRGGIGTYRVPLYRLLVDGGWRGERSMLIDVSGAAGAPLLVAIADAVRWHEPDAKEDFAVEWRFPLAEGGELAIDGAGFSLTRAKGTLRVACLGVEDLRNTRTAGSGRGEAEEGESDPGPDPADLPPHLRGKVKKKEEKEDEEGRPHFAGEPGIVGTGGASTACVFVLGEDPSAIAVDGNVVTVGARRLELVDGAWRVP